MHQRWGRSSSSSSSSKVFRVGLAVTAVLTAGLVIQVSPVDAAFPGRNGKILCARSLPIPNAPPPPAAQTQAEIFSFNPDGSDVRRLTDSPGPDIEATMSPDGTRIAFTSQRTGDQEIWVMYQDGSGLKRLTFSPGEDRPGTFSPDGTQIAFHSGRFPVPPGPGHSSLEIMVMNADGTNQRRMTNNNFQDSFAHWSPQGDRIAFTTNRDTVPGASNFEIYTLVPVDANNDGNADVQTRVTNSPGEDAHAHWSPDGRQLTFHSRRDFLPAPTALQIEIYRSNADGSNPVRLTGPDNVFDVFPSWSPDGQRILWSRNFPSDAFTMNASDGGGRTNVTNSPEDDSRCDWGRLLECTVTGSGVISGTRGNDVICGSAGNDRITGQGGNDVIYPGGGDDVVTAGAGNDIVFGDRGNDFVSGESGDDTLFGDWGFDALSGGPGNDILSGSEDRDRISGDDGTDECYGEALSTCP